ncbi:MAG: ABC transporter permease [Chloroflexaceae bacterium]|jgi:NitT/TauT family transport system permease protein|nr:ABC transporter permease [Chloroflexaceae bacterium]
MKQKAAESPPQATVSSSQAGQAERAAGRSLALVGPWLRRIVFYAMLLALWEGLARSGIWPPWLFPGPLTVAGSLLAMAQGGLLFNAGLVSIQRIAIGYAISLAIGVPLGLLIGRVRLVGETVGSLVVGLQALPSVCWLPLAILWMGLSERAIIFVVVLGALFSITLGVEAGVKNTPPLYLRAARTLGARGLALYSQVILPAALPAVISGLKQGWAFAWRSLMAGELLFYTLSLGNLLQTGRDLNDAAQVMAVMLVIILVGVTVDQVIFAPLERRVRERWGLVNQETV